MAESEEKWPWLDDEIVSMKKGGAIYRFFRFFLRRRLKYKELYLILVELYRSKLGPKAAKELSLARVLAVYRENNGKFPEMEIKEEGRNDDDK